ncbi:MAG TPA: TetR/AcrR family transcriptional regulator [Galbitalea sp.]
MQKTTELSGLLPERAELSGARLRLFSTALVLFGERGYHGVSVRDITDALGQKPGAIYAHVQSKQELLYELVRIGHAEHRERLRAALETANPDPVSQIRAIVIAHVRVHLEYVALARVANHEFRFLDEQQIETILAVQAESEFLLLDVIERGRQTGEFGVADARLAVSAIGSMGVRTAEWWRPDLRISPDHLAETYADFAVNLLR